MKSDGFSVLRGCRNSDHKVHKEQVLANWDKMKIVSR